MYRSLLAGLVAVVLTACGGSSGSNINFPPLPDTTVVNFEVIHASQDAPAVDVIVDGATIQSALAYGTATFAQTNEGTVTIEVQGLLPAGPTTVIGPVDIAALDGDRVTIIAAGDVANIDAIVLSEAQPDVATTDVRVRVVHAAATAPMVDVYVTDTVTDISTVAPLGTFEFGGDLGPVVIPEGEYRIQVTIAGDPSTVAFDSGAVDLAGGSDLVVTAIPNTGPGGAAVELLATVDGASLRLLDTNTPTAVRVVHNSSDAPAIDVVAADNFASPAVSNLAFPDFTGYLELAPGPLNVKVVPTSATSPVVIDADLDLVASDTLTVIAMDVLANIQPLVLTDDPRPVATEARVRIIHGSTLAGNVDIYVTEPGADISAATAAFADVPFLADTGYVSLAGGDYDVTVTAAGDTTPAIGPVALMLEEGSIYTAIARDGAGATTPLGLILLDDF